MPKKTAKSKETSNIKVFLNQYKPQKSSSLICFEKCGQCIVLQDGKEVFKSANDFVSKDVKVFDYTQGKLVQKEFPKFFYQNKFQDVCLRFDIFSNGASSNFTIYSDEKYTYYESYFNKISEFSSSDAAIDFFSSREKLIPFSQDVFAKE